MHNDDKHIFVSRQGEQAGENQDKVNIKQPDGGEVNLPECARVLEAYGS
jgi:hypothetical protein